MVLAGEEPPSTLTPTAVVHGALGTLCLPKEHGGDVGCLLLEAWGQLGKKREQQALPCLATPTRERRVGGLWWARQYRKGLDLYLLIFKDIAYMP